MFVDQVTVHLRAGNGGAGVVSYVRSRGKPRGKPIGGSGGSGGDVYIEADQGVATLLTYQRNPHHAAGSGSHGRGDLQHGRRGEDLTLRVPLGTTVRDDEGTLLADLVKHGQRIKALEGGRGGGGNAAFISSKRRAPGFSEQGEYGESASITLEVKLLADAALIGFPNAGKSTLISAISAAKPRIADYPFTTLEPNLGVVSIGEREFVVADIPGLIEGASEGKGLGHEFLRHVERARALVVLLDPSPLQTASPEEQYRVLLDELRLHSEELVHRPRVIALSKADLFVDESEIDALASAMDESTVFSISAVVGRGLEPFLHAVADAVDLAVRSEPEREGFILHRPVKESFEVIAVPGGWEVVGRAAERAVRLDDLTVPMTADFVARRLERLGIDDALREAGAVAGDEVRIGELVFEFSEFDDEIEEGDSPVDRVGGGE
ncbi:MAG: GTPase ObgE [Acidimicrobiia bacterium]|nr:GTPase ObgE [Acidimicrobiia bacterium]